MDMVYFYLSKPTKFAYLPTINRGPLDEFLWPRSHTPKFLEFKSILGEKLDQGCFKLALVGFVVPLYQVLLPANLN